MLITLVSQLPVSKYRWETRALVASLTVLYDTRHRNKPRSEEMVQSVAVHGNR